MCTGLPTLRCVRVWDTLPEGFVGEDEEELYAQCITGVFAGEEVHLAGKALFLLWPDSEMPPAL